MNFFPLHLGFTNLISRTVFPYGIELNPQRLGQLFIMEHEIYPAAKHCGQSSIHVTLTNTGFIFEN
jgi:hypothetical protein